MNLSKINSAVEGVINAVMKAKTQACTTAVTLDLEDALAYLLNALRPFGISPYNIAEKVYKIDSTEAKITASKTIAAEVSKELDAVLASKNKPVTAPEAIYGYCPDCGCKGLSRERRVNGFDTCVNKHKYLSSDATPYKGGWKEKPKVTLSGKAAELGKEHGAPAAINPATGQHKDYWVLPPEELAKGFIRPVRKVYLHVGDNPVFSKNKETGYAVLVQVQGKEACGTRTVMNQTIAETYARDPKYYGSTFCCSCGKHIPVDQFVWEGTDERVGS